MGGLTWPVEAFFELPTEVVLVVAATFADSRKKCIENSKSGLHRWRPLNDIRLAYKARESLPPNENVVGKTLPGTYSLEYI